MSWLFEGVGTKTINEIREEYDLPPIEGGNLLAFVKSKNEFGAILEYSFQPSSVASGGTVTVNMYIERIKPKRMLSICQQDIWQLILPLVLKENS